MHHPTATAAWLERPVESGSAAGFGVYLHVPFCHHRCGYCDFATAAVGEVSHDDREALFDRYTDTLIDDLRRQVAAGPDALARAATGEPAHPDAAEARRAWPTVTSIFVGGGTPTLLGGERLGRVLATVGELLEVAGEAEVTVECNPETASTELFAALVAAGVTRVSMGAQSFATSVLRTLERSHAAERPLEAVEQARAAGVEQVSLDLIYGTPGETDDDWHASLLRAAAAGIDHLSAYALTIHDNTAFGRAVAEGAMRHPDDDVQASRFERAREVLAGLGFEHYEISNWARRPVATGSAEVASAPSGTRSRHNLLYWRHGDYLGVGVGAHAHLSGRRWWTTRSTSRYLEAVWEGRSPISGGEVLDEHERAVERLMLGLRVREGLHPNDVPPIAPLALEDAIEVGLLETACGRLRCTETGWFLLDEAVERLIVDGAERTVG